MYPTLNLLDGREGSVLKDSIIDETLDLSVLFKES